MKRSEVIKTAPTFHGLESDASHFENFLVDADGVVAEARIPKLIPGRDAYVLGQYLRPLAKRYGRFWAFHSAPTTVALPDNCFAKSLKGFTHHGDEESFRALLAECAEHGIARPSGYADVFHQYYRSPRVHWSVNALLAPAFAGGWQEAIRPGLHLGRYHKYDMRSAYLWASTLGMPDVKTYQKSQQIGRFNGVYRVLLMHPNPGAPFPFNRSRECLATTEEIETYNLKVQRVINGVIWKRTIPGDQILDAIMKVSFWKQAGRSYWGQWSQMERVECFAGGRRWRIPNLSLNLPWAQVVVSRVKKRLWEASPEAMHVFVDSIITPREIKVGSELGDWRLEHTYENGVLIRGTGQYGDPTKKKLDRAAGIGHNSKRRDIAC